MTESSDTSVKTLDTKAQHVRPGCYRDTELFEGCLRPLLEELAPEAKQLTNAARHKPLAVKRSPKSAFNDTLEFNMSIRPRYGPIVMNTQEQLQEAFAELREGTF